MCYVFQSNARVIPSSERPFRYPEGFHIPSSCTIFTAALGDTVLFGNNEDYYLHGTYFWLAPSQEIVTPLGPREIYGCAFLLFDNNGDDFDGYPQGGINVHGLCLDGNGLPEVPLNPNPEGEPIFGPFLAQILWECRTVDEVITWLYLHNTWSTWAGQLHAADAAGEAVVVSVVDQEFVFTRKGTADFIVSTNFNVADPSNAYEYPCWRYQTATDMLEDITQEADLTVEAFRDILDAVHQTGTYGTKWSNIFNPVTQAMYIYQLSNFEEVVTLDLHTELAQVVPGAAGVSNVDDLHGALTKVTSIAELFELPSENSENPNDVMLLGGLVVGVVATSVIVTVSVLFLRKRRAR